MGTIRFILRTEQPDKTGKAPIDLIYQLHGRRKFIRTEEKVFPCNWNAKEQEAIYIDKKVFKTALPGIDPHKLIPGKDIHLLNARLNSWTLKITSIENSFVSKNEQYTVEKIKRELIAIRKASAKTIKEKPSSFVLNFIDTYVTDHKTSRKPGSLKVYNTLKAHLTAYVTKTRTNITFQNIDNNFFLRFQRFLIEERNINDTTIAKQLSTLKTFLSYARLSKIEVNEEYKLFKIRRPTLEVIALTNAEFEKLFFLDFSEMEIDEIHKIALSKVRDVFCFSCATGLRYSDLKQLRREHIRGNEIHLTVEKTEAPLMIPLTYYSDFILNKYKDLLFPLPVISNVNMNLHLKDLCKLAKINDPIEIVRYRGPVKEKTVYKKYELISVHVGRKTFATLSLEKGMSAEETMAAGGWRDYKSFKRYVNVTEQRKKIVMHKAWGEPEPYTKLKAM